MNSDQQGQLQLVQLIFGLAVISGVVLNYYALYVLKSFSEEDYRLIGKNRSQQKTLHIIGIFALGIGAISGWYWLLKTKPKLDELLAKPHSPTTQNHRNPQVGNQQYGLQKSDFPSVDKNSQIATERDSAAQLVVNESIGDSFANHVELFTSLPNDISENEIDLIVSTSARSYAPTQLVQTGLHLSDLIQKSRLRSTINGSVFLETYLIGTQLCQNLLSQNPVPAESIFDIDEYSRQIVLDAVHDDAEYFFSMNQPDIYLTFQTLPIGIRFWFTTYTKVIMKDEFSTENHDVLLKAFLSGMLYVAFQSKSSGD